MRRVGRRGRRRRCGPAGALASSMSVVRETRVSCQTVHERRAGRSSFGSPIHPGSMSSRVGSRAGSRPEARARRQRTGRQRLRHEGSDEELGGRRSALRATRRSGELRARYAGRTLGRSLTPSYTGIRAPQTKHRGAPGIRAARHETSRKGPTVDRLPLLHGHSRPAGSWNESSRRVAPQERIISISAHLDGLFFATLEFRLVKALAFRVLARRWRQGGPHIRGLHMALLPPMGRRVAASDLRCAPESRRCSTPLGSSRTMSPYKVRR